MKKHSFLFLLLAVAVMTMLLNSCTEIPYMVHCAKGHLQLLSKRQPVEKVLNDPGCQPQLKHQLETSQLIRDFASRELLLPDNGSYRSYADLERPYAVWNVVAAPEFSLTPVQWCFPFAGCVSYRGYYTQEKARRFAEKLQEQGKDVYLYGVAAYSTLNWFDDPLLNTFSNDPAPDLAGLIFHELAHQLLYIKGDSAFNEAFAQTVERAGVLRWLDTYGTVEEQAWHANRSRREEDFLALIGQTRQELVDLYGAGLPEAAMRQDKEDILKTLRHRYEELRQAWGGYRGYDRWFEKDLNNARFVSIDTYRRYVPAFEALLRRSGGDLRQFYALSRRLSELTQADRSVRLEALLKEAGEGEVLAAAP